MKKIILFKLLLSIFYFPKFLAAENKKARLSKIAKISGRVIFTVGLICLILKKDKKNKIFNEKFEELKKLSTSFLNKFSKNNKIKKEPEVSNESNLIEFSAEDKNKELEITKSDDSNNYELNLIELSQEEKNKIIKEEENLDLFLIGQI